MLGSPRIMDALKGIGLNLYERKLWVALLTRGTSTAGELSELANVPRSRTYDILQSLADKGFVIVQTAKPIRYVAMTPSEALERGKKKFEEDIRIMQERIDELKESKITKDLTEMYKKGLKLVMPGDMTGALKGTDSVSHQLSSMFREASKKISIVTTPDGLNDLLSKHMRILKKAKKKGVDIKIAINETRGCTDAIKALGEVAEIRGVDEKEIPMAGRFCVVDDKELMFSLTDMKSVHATQDVALWSKSEHAAKNVLDPIFNLVWSHSEPVS